MQATICASSSLSTFNPKSVSSFTNAQVNFRFNRVDTHQLNISNARRNTMRTAATEGEAASEFKPVAPAPAPASAATDPATETIFYEGNGSDVETILSVLLGATLVYLPLTMASLGRRLWMKYKFTDRRIIVEINSPLVKRTDVIEYPDIKEVRTAPRAFGAWGDMVIFLKNGSRLEILGLERIDELRDYVEGKIIDE
jgi:hypothetical protein